MNDSTNGAIHNQMPDPEEIAHLARTHAQNRPLLMLVYMVFGAAVATIIAAISYRCSLAYHSGNMVALLGYLTVLALALGLLVYASMPPWSRKLKLRIYAFLYRNIGHINLSVPQHRIPYIRLFCLVGIAIFIALMMILDTLGLIPPQHLQPVSALFLAPLLVGSIVSMRPATGYLMLLWPTLYALHAILMVTGVLEPFTGTWEFLNILLPITGYGILAGLVSYTYGHWALHRLKKLAMTGISGNV